MAKTKIPKKATKSHQNQSIGNGNKDDLEVFDNSNPTIVDLKSEIEQKRRRLEELKMARLKREGISMESVNEIVNSLLGNTFNDYDQSTQTDTMLIRDLHLSVSKMERIIIDRENLIETYSKSVQTDAEVVIQAKTNEPSQTLQQDIKDSLPPSQNKVDTKEIPKELGDQEKEAILQSPEFNEFFDRASTVIERCLSSTYDIFKDYSVSSEKLESFKSQKYLFNQSNVTSLEWSTRHKELIMAGHGDGCYIWNIHMQSRPEQSFTAPLGITCAAYNIYGDTIFGGLVDGNVCIWDPRCKPVPVLSSTKRPLVTSNRGHDYSIKEMKIVGQRNAHVLMTSSEDKVCGWDITMLARPLEEIPVDHTTMAFMPDTGSFYVGRGDGILATVNR